MSKLNMKPLYDRRDQLKLELEAAKARLDEIESMISAMTGVPAQAPVVAAPTRTRRGNLKEIVLGLYDQAGEEGLSASDCVAAAQSKHNITLQPASVSSLLSRLKSDGVLMYDGVRYRLKQFAGPRTAA